MAATPDSGYSRIPRNNNTRIEALKPLGAPRFLWLLLLAAAICCIWLAGGCAPIVPEPTTTTPEPTVTPPENSEDIPQYALWQASAHADTYAVGEINNNECARCHSPHDWTPVKSEDMPESCSSCKFTVPVPETVPEADWNAVQCDSCHRISDGEVSAEVMWFNASKATGFGDAEDPYEIVADNMELCRKCHTDREPFVYARDLGENVHTELQCTSCHDPHTLVASCNDCHMTTDDGIAGHDASHQSINCTACHDASGLEVGSGADGSVWTAMRTTESPGNSGTNPYISHNLQRAVDCARCHYAANPWGISESVPAS